ncbi:sulfatase-like hydrolase/transferase [Halosolutus amylolyticus]|uniref:Sulfatase-like hydrolase/transferase n=1 Tax=Halosolutus amylolyticus TaxID=2932267 RepID=A0ABD5PS58_9EURY|nr:sulfatase-like hydrolase/transferase [Halosolutus amylolyticus]
MKTLLVTVDSLRHDHFEYMPNTLTFLDMNHNRAFAPSTATIGSFPGIIGGEFANGAGLTGTSIATRFDEYSVGLTTNHLLSEEYGYDEGFDVFNSPKGGGDSIKDKAAIYLTRGSFAYRLASWGWSHYQRLTNLSGDVEKSFRSAEKIISQFDSEIDNREEWFGWLHFMEPHHPYDPDGSEMSRAQAQRLTRKVLAGSGGESDQERVRELYRLEVAELDKKLDMLWKAIPDDTRVVFCADHGELLGEDGMWGHPGEMRPELLRVPFGTKNAPEIGGVVSLLDVPSILLGSEYGLGELDRDVAFATYGVKKAAMNANNIATDKGVISFDSNEPTEDPSLERALDRFEPGSVVKEDALKEDLEDLGYA